ncbi:MAG: hypothetical protein K5930_09245 [Treponemataceae bacterium]|nr:hypothetical protein [Treponemataceae bacterium]
MILDLLPPDNTLELIVTRLKKLEVTLKTLKTRNDHKQSEHLRISKKGKYIEYYQVEEENAPLGNYISLKNEKLIRQLAQKDYNRKLIKLLEDEILATKKYISKICGETPSPEKTHYRFQSKIIKFYNDLNPARKEFIIPVTLTDEEYAEKWQKVTWQGIQVSTDLQFFYTARGERVRSKSEVLIADALHRHKIPYRYEYPAILEKYSRNSESKKESLIFYPDFLCLNTHSRQEIIWEHFGLMDFKEYSQNAIRKLNIYTENGIFPGHRLITTMETKNQPLSTQSIEKTIKEYF